MTFQTVYNKYSFSGVTDRRTMEVKLNAMFAELYVAFPGSLQQEIKLTTFSSDGTIDSYGETLRKIREMSAEIKANSGFDVSASQVVYPGDFQDQIVDRLGIFAPSTSGLLPLVVGGLSVSENSPLNTVIGGVAGGTLGSSITLVGNAGGRVTLSGTTLRVGSVAIDFEQTPNLSISLRQSLAGYADRVDTFNISVTNVLEAAILSALGMSSLNYSLGTPSGGAITGASAGSTITASGLPAGLTINSALRTWSYDGSGSASSTPFTLIETLGDSPNSPRNTALTAVIANVVPSLASLTLASSSVPENSASGTVVGGIVGTTSGSTVTMTSNAGNRFAISGNSVVVGSALTDFESATSHSVTIRETLAGSPNSPRDTTLSISVTNVLDAPALSALSFSSTAFTVGSTSNGAITGATSGSTITASGLPTGLTINGPARTWAYDGVGGVTTANVTLTETLGDSPNSPRASVVAVSVTATVPSLSVLSLSASSLTENSTPGTVIGSVQGLTAGSTLTLSANAGNRFAISGNNLVAGSVTSDFESSSTQSVTLRETLAGSPNTPRDTVVTINIANVFEAPTLSALAFSSTSFVLGTASNGSITGTTTGSTLTASGLPTGVTINGPLRTWTYDGLGTVGSTSVTLTETLADSANSPRVTSATLVVNPAALGTLTLSNASFAENTTAGVVIGSISGKSANSTLTLPSDAGGRVALSGTNLLVGLVNSDFEQTPTHNVTVRETLAGSANSPKDTGFTITVTDVVESVTTETTTMSSLVDRGVTYTFAAPTPVGYYAAGDPFAVNPTVTRAEPDSTLIASGTFSNATTYTNRWVNGLMVNPGTLGGTGANPSNTPQGFDTVVATDPNVTEFTYDHTLNLDPVKNGASISGTGKTIVKAKSVIANLDNSGRARLSDLSYLTLVDASPPAGSFRRWAGSSNKNPIFFITDINWSLLPVLTQPAGSTLPTASALLSKLGTLSTFANQMLSARGTNPLNQQSQYGADIAGDILSAMFYTMTSGVSVANRNLVGTAIIQAALDVYDAHEAGRRWSSVSFSFGGAHQWLKVLVVYASTLLSNAANVTERNKLASWVDGTTKRVFGEDMMVIPVTRSMIEANPYESITTRLYPTGFRHHDENMIDWLSKPSSLDSVTFSPDVAYRAINYTQFMCTALVTRLLGKESAWNNPNFFSYCDRFFNIRENRGLGNLSYLQAYCRDMLLAYYRTNAPNMSGSGPVPAVARFAARDNYVWAEYERVLDIRFQPTTSQMSVVVNGATQTLSNVTTNGTGVESNASTGVNTSLPTVSVTNATGIYVGMKVTGATLSPDSFVTSVSGTTIGISSTVPAAFSAQPLTFSPVYVFGHALVAVLPTSLAFSAVPVTLAYTAPGTGFVRDLRGTSVQTFAANSCVNRTNELPGAVSTRATAYGGSLAATRQFCATTQFKPQAFTRMLLAVRFQLKSAMVANQIIISSSNASSGTFNLYAATASDLRMGIYSTAGSRTLRMPGILTGVPIDKPLSLFIFVDMTQTTIATCYKAVIKWDTGSTSSTLASSVPFTGTENGSMEAMLLNGLFVTTSGSGENILDGGVSEIMFRIGDGTMAMPADFNGASYAWNANWGGNGELLHGAQPQYYWAGSIDEWNAGLLNRGSGGSLGMSLRRFNVAGDPESGPTVLFEDIAPATVTISGTPPPFVVGQPYDFQYTVTPPGAVTFDAASVTFFASKNIAHNGTGRLTSASVS